MSWEQLGAILDEGRQAAEEGASKPPTRCPNDAFPLKTGPDGGLFCEFDGWRPAGLPPPGPSPW